ncbi:hypothetical protein [Streptomyces sp. NPDC053427]|uniref:hypothetical protein n=1 Tax=Streptomyces sp. NPDC053427 TaxID=3365701 RepID=UPI0037D0BDBC
MPMTNSGAAGEKDPGKETSITLGRIRQPKSDTAGAGQLGPREPRDRTRPRRQERRKKTERRKKNKASKKKQEEARRSKKNEKVMGTGSGVQSSLQPIAPVRGFTYHRVADERQNDE